MKALYELIKAIMKAEGIREDDSNSEKSYREKSFYITWGGVNPSEQGDGWLTDNIAASIELKDKYTPKNKEIDLIDLAQKIRLKVLALNNSSQSNIMRVEAGQIGTVERQDSAQKVVMDFNFLISSNI